jgi:hypothetical protein
MPLLRSVTKRDEEAIFQASAACPFRIVCLRVVSVAVSGIEIDPFDLLKAQVGDGAILAGHVESLVGEQGENAAFGFRAVLEFDYIRPDARCMVARHKNLARIRFTGGDYSRFSA